LILLICVSPAPCSFLNRDIMLLKPNLQRYDCLIWVLCCSTNPETRPTIS
jgi:hypothetical protein